MKLLIKIIIGVCAVGGFLYWLLSVFLRPTQKMREKLEKVKFVTHFTNQDGNQNENEQ